MKTVLHFYKRIFNADSQRWQWITPTQNAAQLVYNHLHIKKKKTLLEFFNGSCSRLSCCTAALMCSLLPVMSDTPPPLPHRWIVIYDITQPTLIPSRSNFLPM